MNLFLIILFSIPCLAIAWWVWAFITLRALKRARLWRALLTIAWGLMLAGYIWVVGRRAELWTSKPPLVWITSTYVWTLVIFPGSLAASTPLVLADHILRWRRQRRAALQGEAAAQALASSEPASPARRAFLGALIAAPPTLTILCSGKALAEMDSFRVRRIDVPFAALPADLDGVSIAHITDMHVGNFTSERLLRRVSDVTNSLRPDIVLSTGDLIDHAIADLPAGAAALNRTDAPYGLFACEGNHDLFESRARFAEGMRQASVPLLQNQRRLISIRGVPVELMGICWGLGDVPKNGVALEANAGYFVGTERHGAFSILLAHHPHAFDFAAPAGVHLTLSGHTHGGQLNPLPGLCPTRLFFKYLSGLYTQGTSKLVVSNGVGNGFPMRFNAPAEIVLVTLRRG